ncbi:MAG: hypothetical protein WA584_19515 [Pyrinomonadaceae bacterium]
MQEQELFQQYELKGWQISPRLYKIVGASVIANLVAFALMAQANFLTGKTCDSPVASGVCSVLDALYVGSNIGDYDYVSKDYSETQISDSDEIIMVNLDGEYPPLTYPAGYFALANPDQQPAVTDVFDPTKMGTTDFPGMTNTNPTITTTPDLSAMQPTLPKPGKNTVIGNLPNYPSNDANPTITKKPGKGFKNKPIPTLEDVNGKKTADNKTDKTDETQNPVSSEPVKIDINKKPFENLGDDINASVEKKEVDLTKPFTVILDGTILADGRLDATKSKFIKSEGDEKMRLFAEQAIKAVGDSGFLVYLKNQNIDRINLMLVQNDEGIIVKIISDQKTPERAKKTVSGLNLAISAVKFADANGGIKLDERSKVLLEKAQISNDGKNFIFDFTLPKADAQKLIINSLTERAEKKNKQLNSSSELNKNTSTEAGK